MTHWKSFTDSELLGAWDLPDGKDVVVEIAGVEGGELHRPGTGKTDRRPIVSFKGAKKKLVLNATNGKAVESMYGSQVEGWVGKKIALYVSQARNPQATRDNPHEPKMVDCVRVRPRKPE